MKCVRKIFLAGGLALAVTAASAQPTAVIDAAMRQETVEGAIRQLNDHYVFPDVAKKAEGILTHNLRSRGYDGLDDAARFAAKLTEDLQAVTSDKHIRVLYSTKVLAEKQSEIPGAEQIEEYRKRAAIENYGIEKVERLPLNIGYIDLRSFASADVAAEAIAAAMTLVANTDALIVDLRRNGGGDPATVAFMSSYLFDERTHLNSLYWRDGNRTDQFWTQNWVPGKRFGQKKPVYVLTGKRTFSGAEEFSYNLKNLKRAIIVGETTGGGAHPGDFQRLSAHFRIFVPNGRAISPITNTNWEGTGVEPDIKVPADDALRVAEIQALKKIRAGEKGMNHGERLQKRIDDLDKQRTANGTN